MKKGLLIISLGACVASAHAYSIFDFESSAATSNFSGSTGGYTVLNQTNAGLTLSITRSTGNKFDVFDNPTMGGGFHFPLTWGNRSLSPFFASAANDMFVGNFSSKINAVELEGLDFSPDSDTLTMEVWSGLNGTGTLITTVSNFWGLQTGPSYAAVGWNANGSGATALSIRFRGGSTAAPQSMFIDNIAAQQAVPEPATMAALGIGVAALLRRRRK
jgi:hypothetical protein